MQACVWANRIKGSDILILVEETKLSWCRNRACEGQDCLRHLCITNLSRYTDPT